jgi:hypothetical protein
MNVRPTSIYALPDLAEDLGISLRTLQRAVKAGKLHAVRAGLHTFATGKNILSWMEGGAEVSPAPKNKPVKAGRSGR